VLSPATVLTTIHAVQVFFRWLAREPGYRSKIRAADIRYFNLSRKDVATGRAARTKKVPTLQQIRAVILAMPDATEIERRDRALIAFTIVTGMRDSAIASLRLKHVDLEERLVIQDPREVNTKFSKRIETFFFPVGDEIEQIVIEWVRELREVKLYGENDPVFPRTRVAPDGELLFAAQGLEPVLWSSAGPIRRVFKEAFALAGLSYFTPHSFRSTLATYGQRICRSPEQLKAWSQNLGHESLLTTFTSYGHVPLHRQGELVRNATTQDGSDSKLDRLMQMVENMQAR
jgi:integrase